MPDMPNQYNASSIDSILSQYETDAPGATKASANDAVNALLKQYEAGQVGVPTLSPDATERMRQAVSGKTLPRYFPAETERETQALAGMTPFQREQYRARRNISGVKKMVGDVAMLGGGAALGAPLAAGLLGGAGAPSIAAAYGQLAKSLLAGGAAQGALSYAMGGAGEKARQAEQPALESMAAGQPGLVQKGLAYAGEALPTIAETIPAAGGALAGAATGGAFAPKEGPSPIPIRRGKETSRLLDILSEQFGTPRGPREPIVKGLPEMEATTTRKPQLFGAFKDSLSAGRRQLGAELDAVRQPLIEQAIQQGQETKIPDAYGQAILKSLADLKAPKGKGSQQFDISRAPEGIQKMWGKALEAPPETFEQALVRQREWSQLAADTRKAAAKDPTSTDAATYETFARNLSDAMDNLLPETGRPALAAAKKKFSGYDYIQRLAMKSADAQGNFDAGKFVANYRKEKPSVIEDSLGAETKAQLDALTKQKGIRTADLMRRISFLFPGGYRARHAAEGLEAGDRSLRFMLPAASRTARAIALGGASLAPALAELLSPTRPEQTPLSPTQR